MAPEIHICRQNPTPYNPLCSDIFALGVILFAVMLGRLPFELAVLENKVFNLLKEGKIAEFWAFHQI
jgi:serine/threonine protein kinase